MGREQKKPLILFDVTRLIQRRRASIATGIDRIDVQWAQAIFDHFGPDCLPVMLHKGQPLILRDEQVAIRALIRSQIGCWFCQQEPDEQIVARLDRAGLAANAGYGSRKVEKQIFAGKSRRTQLMQSVLPQFAYALKGWLWSSKTQNEGALEGVERLVYVNASHMGLPQKAGALSALANGRSVRLVPYIHDLIPIEFPEYAMTRSTSLLRDMIAEIERYPTSYTTNSVATAHSLERYLSLASRKETDRPSGFEIKAFYPGFTAYQMKVPAVASQPRHDEGGPVQFVIIGTIEPRKNHLLLLHLWRQMVEEGFTPMPRLTIIGRRGWGADGAIAMLDHCEQLRPYIREINDASDAEMFDHLSKAAALLFPSFTEGFGLPLMEAAEMGVPVIASDLAVFRELVDAGVTFLHPLDAEGWKEAICKAALDPLRLSRPTLKGMIGGWDVHRKQFAAFVSQVADEETTR
nr:glycosyltransferase family 1 protein [uncultured Cohaesibacter sp.]